MMDYGVKPKQGFYGRLLKKAHAEGIEHDLKILFPNVESACSLSNSDIEKLLSENNASSDKTAFPIVDSFFDSLIQTATPEQIVRNCLKKLTDLAKMLGANPDKLESAAKRISVSHFRNAYEAAISRGPVSGSARDRVLDFGASIGLSINELESAVNDLVMPRLALRVEEYLQDTMLSPQEEDDLNRYADDLGIKLDFSPENKKILSVARQRWQIFNGNLPIVDSPLMLKKVRFATEPPLRQCMRKEAR